MTTSETAHTKRCKKCKRLLKSTCFHVDNARKDGRHIYCVDCVRPMARQRAAKFREKNPNATTRWRAKNPEAARRAMKKWRSRNREKTQASNYIGRMVRDGKIIRPDKCEVCDCIPSETLHGHHDSYEKDRWLTVCWMCRKCHKWTHAKRREQPQGIERKVYALTDSPDVAVLLAEDVNIYCNAIPGESYQIEGGGGDLLELAIWNNE